MEKRQIDISGFFFLILFLGFFGSTVFFNHTHISEGRIIVHSHPFKSDPAGKPLHDHSKPSYVLIHLLDTFIALTGIGLSLASVIYLLTAEFLPKTTISFVSKVKKVQLFLRGPPDGILI